MIMVMFGISLITVIFLVPETMASFILFSIYKLPDLNIRKYDRQQVLESEDSQPEILYIDADEKKEVTVVERTEAPIGNDNPDRVAELGHCATPPKTFMEELRPWSYTSDTSFVRALLRPFPFFLSPPVWFTFFPGALKVRITNLCT